MIQNHSTPDAEFEIIPETFEGPPQRVARNTIYLIDFEEDKDAATNSIVLTLKPCYLDHNRFFQLPEDLRI